MNTSPLPDPLDDFLNRPPSLPVDTKLKEMLFQQTAPLRPWPRHRRALVAMAGVAGVVLAFVLSYFFFRAENGDSGLPSDRHGEHNKVQAAGAVKPDHPLESSPPVQAAAQPRDVEWRAFDANDDRERARLYFRAGDLYLGTEQDIDAALRCYRQALAYCDARLLEFDPRDNWLVMALKNDRRKEP